MSDSWLISTKLEPMRTFIDILIVAFVIYKLLLLIKGNKGCPTPEGVGSALVTSAVSAQFHLSTISWLLGKNMDCTCCGVPVVFSRSRASPGAVGRGSLFGRRSLLAERRSGVWSTA